MFSNNKISNLVAALATAFACVEASHLDNTNGVFDSFSFDEVKFKTRTNCSLDKYPEIRSWLDSDAAQFTQTPILVASDGMSRLELFKEGVLIDTVHVYRYSKEQLNDLLVEMGQPRDKSMTWEKINAMQSFDKMLNNWGAYSEIIQTPEEKAATE
mmetsp:Transcript_41881/g.55213  ORF Transcript_41881/g.55213 Transcript_41881/m.55213 type:complete len:156 (-) Transcript_41881:161-628(-)